MAYFERGFRFQMMNVYVKLKIKMQIFFLAMYLLNGFLNFIWN